MSGRDIKLTLEGASILKNGDFDLEGGGDLSMANRLLRSSKGAWKFDPDIGIGLQDYAGKPNNQATATEIEDAVINGLKKVGINSQCVVYPLSFDAVAIKVSLPTPEGTKDLDFSFTYKEGLVEYRKNQGDVSVFKTRETVNKYDRRRP